jgi:cation diffusion facilitator CzcD-associated flavoprotein CzcO
VDLDTGEPLTARYVVGATGVLTQPKAPDIAGLASFAGTVMHTARWDHSVDLRGKRVAIIGTGASAVQVIPSIAPEVQQLTGPMPPRRALRASRAWWMPRGAFWSFP